MAVKQWNNVVILDSKAGHFPSNLPKRNSPLPKRRALIFGKILVQQVQGAAMVGAAPSQADWASFTASATADKGMRPFQRLLQINSHERPSATSSSTCQTMIRVPLKVGCPWQISGSAAMWRPSSTRFEPDPRAEVFPFFISSSILLDS